MNQATARGIASRAGDILNAARDELEQCLAPALAARAAAPPPGPGVDAYVERFGDVAERLLGQCEALIRDDAGSLRDAADDVRP